MSVLTGKRNLLIYRMYSRVWFEDCTLIRDAKGFFCYCGCPRLYCELSFSFLPVNKFCFDASMMSTINYGKSRECTFISRVNDLFYRYLSLGNLILRIRNIFWNIWSLLDCRISCIRGSCRRVERNKTRTDHFLRKLRFIFNNVKQQVEN